MSEEPRLPVKNNIPISQRKCRIPRRLPARHRLHNNSKSTSEYQNKGDSMYQSRNGLRYMARPSSAESHPKSANQAAEVMGDIVQMQEKSRSFRPGRDKLLPAPKKPVHRKKTNDASLNEARKQIIKVPVTQNFLYKPSNQNRSQLPNQETIKKFEELEIKKDFYDSPSLHDEDELFIDFNDEENVSSKKDEVMQLRTLWQEKIVQFDRMKIELNDKQNVLLKVYAALQNTKEKLSKLGQCRNLPSIDDLRIMNVAHMTPNQLLQMCTESGSKIDSQQLTNNILTVNIKKINDIPTRLISTCERTLASRKDIIKCFENLENQEMGSSKSSFSKKINEFILENETLKSDLYNVKNIFLNDLNEFVRKCCDEILAFQQRNQTLTHELQKLRSQSTYFRKKVAGLEQQRASANKFKLEELSKELKEEKSKCQMLKQRLTRAEGQLKIHEERATTYESALDQARTQTRNLERTIQQLNEQNRRMQNDFDDELNQLNDSMKKNTKNLEEFAQAREALQSEKEDLKIQLDELSNHYQEHVNNLKTELSQTTEKTINNENKYKQEVEENQMLRSKNILQCEKLKELELCHENALKQLEQMEVTLNETIKYKYMYEELRLELDKNNLEIKTYKGYLDELNVTLTGLRENLHRAHEVEDKLRKDATSKDHYIAELENKQISFHQKSNENEKKLEIYEEQLLSLKNHITTLKEHFGQFENINDIQEMINQQNTQLNDMKSENNKLLNEIEKNQNKLEQLKKATEEQEHVILQNHSVLQILSEKKDEHALSLQLNKEIKDKNDKIESIIATVEMKNHQISQLEKIILTLEESNRNFCIQKQKYHDRINLLENKINQQENLIANRNGQVPHDSLDKLIRILENELDAPYDSQAIRCMEKDKINHKIFNNIHGMPENTKLFSGSDSTTQIIMSNFNKNISASTYEEKHKGDSFDCKQVVPNIDTHEYPLLLKSGSQSTLPPSMVKDDFLQINEFHSANKKQKQNLYYIVPNRAQEKRNKMYKLAGHRVL